MLVSLLSLCSLSAWAAVLLLPSRPWQTRERLEPSVSASRRANGNGANGLGTNDSADLSRVAVLIPARNEAATIGKTLAALAEQGPNLEVIVVDDRSSDGTANAARDANAGLTRPLELDVVDGRALPAGWGGKLWGLEQGLERVERDYCLLLDAEIVLAPGVIAALVDNASRDNRALVSIMATLHCEHFWERLLVPPFIFFFKLLYPFAKVNDPRRRTAAAAGGCLLVETPVLRSIGGFAGHRDALIDDCTLARKVKRAGHSIWLGLSTSVASQREYRDLAGFRRMVTRTAFTQLHYSAVLLVLVAAAMLLVFVMPVAGLALSSDPWSRLAGASALAAMGVAYWPTLRFYGLSPVWALSLPIAALLFLGMTAESALNYWRGVKAVWKGRTYKAG